MRITPLDVRKQEFRRGMRGLDAEEVYAFLSTVADEYEAVLNDNKALRERLLELDDKVQEYRSMERTLRDTLLTAERVNIEAKDNARREASLIVKEAQIEADKALRDIRTEAARLRQQVQQLRSQRGAYLARMKVVAESHLDFVESAHKDFETEDEAIRDPDGHNAPTKPDAPADPPSSLFEERPQAPPADAAASETTEPQVLTAKAPEVEERESDAPRAGTDTAASPGVTETAMADISAIIERMRQGQRETLLSRAAEPGDGAPEGFTPIPERTAATPPDTRADGGPERVRPAEPSRDGRGR